MNIKTSRSGYSTVALAVGLLLAGGVGLAAGTPQGQMQSGQMAGHQHATQAMQGAQANMMSTQQMMQNVDGMIRNATGHMQNLASMQQTMGGMSGNGRLVTSMQDMLDQMKQLQGSMNEWMKDPQSMHNEAGMKSFQEACGNLEQMARSFEEMTKHMNDVLKAAGHEPKR